jgi:aryl-alcohol dehydrogenase-like predicted oxidoreductase
MKMDTRKLGRKGLEVSAIGLGCMGMSAFYGSTDDAESLRVLHRSVELGINFWDTAQMYGPFTNERLLSRALKEIPRRKVIIATKFAWRISPGGERIALDGSPAHVKESIEGSLQRLGTDYVDLYYQHRLDPKTPVEETVGAMAELVKQGKVRFIGLSEVGPGTIRRAHAVYPLAAVQTEYSLWERGVEAKVLPALRELGIGLVAYSPVGRGFLTGRFKSPDELEPADWRRTTQPRFGEENFAHNLELVQVIQAVAYAHGVTAAQLALAWLLRKGPDIVPIPGTRRLAHLEEDARAAEVCLPESAWSVLNKTLASFETAGPRYAQDGLKMIDTTD